MWYLERWHFWAAGGSIPIENSTQAVTTNKKSSRKKCQRLGEEKHMFLDDCLSLGRAMRGE